MMSREGGMRHLNCKASNPNEVDHRSIGALELLPTATSLTAGSQRFSDRVSGSNHLPYKESINIVPNNDHSAAVFPHESSEASRHSSLSSLTGNVRGFPDGLSGSSDLHYQVSNNIVPRIGHSAGVVPQNVDSGAEYAGNSHYNNSNMSIGLGLHSYGPENQNTSNSYTTVIDGGVSGSTVQEQGLDSSSVNMRHLSCKRKSPEHTVRELLVGESSRTAAQTGISKRRVSEVNGNNVLNRSTPCTSPVNHQEQSETIIGHGTTRTVSVMQHLNEARRSENFQSNIHLHTAANRQAFLPTSSLSSGYTRDAHIQLHSQSPVYCQHNHPPFFRSAESSVSAMQPDEHVANFHETLQAPPWINMMRPSSVSPSFMPVYAAVESEVVAPFHYPRNMPENIMLGHQFGRRNWAHDAGNLLFVNGTANFLGDFFCPLHDFVSGTIQPSNGPTWFPGFDFADHYVQTLSGIVNHPVVASTGFPRHSYSPSDLDPSAVFHEMGFSVGFGTASQNQHTSGARSENHAASNFIWSPAHAQSRMRLRPENQHTSEARYENQDVSYHDHAYHSIWSPANAENRRRLGNLLRNGLVHLHSGGPLQHEDLWMLDHSFILHLLMEHADVDEVHFDVDNMAYEELVALEEYIGFVNMGLSEEVILRFLRQEKFQPLPGGSEENECCCICQEEYHENEDLGKLDCGHRFHVDCIKPWLKQKNSCPICKQIALSVIQPAP